MALASRRQWNGSINRFWNAFGSHFAPQLGPHWAPFELHLGLIGPHLGHRDPLWATFPPHCVLFFASLFLLVFKIILTCVFEGFWLQVGPQMEPKLCPSGVTNASCLWWLKEYRFLVRVCLNCIEFRHGCVVKIIVSLGENEHISEMRRCLVATVLGLLLSRTDADLEAFW